MARQPGRHSVAFFLRLDGIPNAAVAPCRLGSPASLNGPMALTLPRPLVLPLARIV